MGPLAATASSAATKELAVRNQERYVAKYGQGEVKIDLKGISRRLRMTGSMETAMGINLFIVPTEHIPGCDSQIVDPVQHHAHLHASACTPW